MEEAYFGIIDYVVFVAVLVVSMGIGGYFSIKGNKSPEDFLMGNRAFGPIPIAMSLLTSYVSAISLLGFSGEAYAYGIQIILFLVGTALGIAAVIAIIIPVLYPLKLTSVNEYIEGRFKSPLLTRVVSLISCLTGLFYMGSCLYAPTIALATVTPISSLTYIFVLGIVVTVYSSIGGIKAVVWTDVFQLTIMLIGLFVIAVVGLVDVGGFYNVWQTSLEGSRLNIANTNPSIYERHTIYNTIAFGFFYNSAFFGISQINVQRVCSVRSFSDAKKILWINALGMVVIYVLIFGGGLIAYTAYEGCDPWLLQAIDKKEEILPHYVVHRLSFAIGLPGLFVATLIGGALSSLSSVMNALVAMIWQDYCLHFKFFAEVKPITASFINKLFSFGIGAFIIGAAIVASKASNIIQFSLSVSGAMFGGVYGVFLLGFLAPKTNLKGVWTGLITSLVLMSWISIGAFFYGKPTKFLPFSTDKCSSVDFNSTHMGTEKDLYTLQGQELPVRVISEEDYVQEDFPLMWLYGISYTLYTGLGALSCIAVAVLVSFFTANRDVTEVCPEYVTPLVRPLYWKKEFLHKMQLEKESLEITTKVTLNGKLKHDSEIGFNLDKNTH